MYKNPDLPVPREEWIFPEGAKKLWLRALEQPEVDLKCRAADAIALARTRGVKGFEPAIKPLLGALDEPDQHPSVRLAAARALIALEARGSAPSLFQHARTGTSAFRDLVEPALAWWDYQPARAEWLKRLRDPATRQRSLVLAIHCLAAVREEQAADRLREMTLSARLPGPIRLEAARALASLRKDGLETDAQRLAADAGPRGIVARLVAATMLSQHQSKQAIELLQRLARDDEPAVAAIACARLLAIDPEQLVPALEQVLASSDPKIRAFGVEVLFRLPSKEHIRLLGDQLDDTHPAVRGKARSSLHALAGKKEFRTQVIAEGARMLGTEHWRGLEQATILLSLLEHKPAAGRLLKLLRFKRPEVYVAAAWGLRKLAVADTLPEVRQFVKAAFQKGINMEMPDHQLSQLIQLLGNQKYAPAAEVLQQFVPRPGMPGREGPESRAAAIWALGMIHAVKVLPDLATALEERLNDSSSSPPEDDRVRWACAITLGRLKVKEVLPSLRKFCPDQEPSSNAVSNACGWAIEQLTGKKMAAPKTIRKVERDWFLTPRE
jgi:HEAT repeat protein